MRYINYLFIMVLFLSACQISTLVDATGNEFSAVATQGEYDDKIVVSWIKRDVYANYTVLKSDTKDGVYYSIGQSYNGESVEDIDIDKGQIYFYKVRGYNKLGTPTFVTDPADGYAGASGGFLPPDNDDITSIPGSSTTVIEFSWNRVPDAMKYRILRQSDNGLLFVEIDTTSFLHYTDKDVIQGRKYYYKITSLNEYGDPSNNSQSFEGELFGADLEFRSLAGAYTDKIQLIWKPYQYANKYSIFRSGNPNEIGNMIKEITISDERAQTGENLEYSDIITDDTGQFYYYTIFYQNESTQRKTDTIRSYLKTGTALEQPQNLKVSQGSHKKDVSLSWDTVNGANSYEIARAVSKNGPWIILNDTTSATSYNDSDIPDDSYTYFYTITGRAPALGAVSEIKEGWANKPPVNIMTSKNFGAKVRLSWDKIPGATLYIVTYSETEIGGYIAANSIPAGNDPKVIFDHEFDIGTELIKDLWYKVEVQTKESQSDPSSAVKGTIKKITAPENVSVRGNKTRTKTMTMTWDPVDGAQGYRIYRAILAHKNASADKLQPSHFKPLKKVDNNASTLSFNTYPIRRYVYEVRAIDLEDTEGLATKTETVWRLPVDARDFAQDVDFTIVQAQTQIDNFGANGSEGNPTGRAGGNYDYKAGLSGSKNIWNNYVSFEVNLNGAQTVTVKPLELSAVLNGDLNVSGLYEGTITYNALAAKAGGTVTGGGMTIKYNKKEEYWPFGKAGGYLKSVVLDGERSPKYPSFEDGYGL